MRVAPGIVLLLVGLALQFQVSSAHAQVITTGPDSVVVLSPETDSIAQQNKFFLSGLKNLDRPGKAALLSAAFPGLGQAYNKAYWKIPIIFATGAVLGYFIIDNNDKYQDFRQATIQRRDKKDKYMNDPIYGDQRPNGAQNLRSSRDFYRRNRDLTIILSVGAYAMNIAEAYVHAHLKEFEVGDDLSLRLQPDLFHTPANRSVAPGLTLTLYTRTK
ncbi:hypothetical protein OB13_18230 [Pontibacter sp. HJ8]